MKQLKVSLPDDLRAKLDDAAAASGRSLADEVRRRLEQTFADDAFGPETREIAADVMWLADEVKRQSGLSWRAYPKAHETLAEALRMWVELNKPSRAPSAAASDLFGPDDPPTLGRAIARHYQRVRELQEKSLQEMRQLHEGKRS